jgi:hypothetical protein
MIVRKRYFFVLGAFSNAILDALPSLVHFLRRGRMKCNGATCRREGEQGEEQKRKKGAAQREVKAPPSYASSNRQVDTKRQREHC